MTIVYTGKFISGYADKIREGTGVDETFLNTYVHRTVLSCSVKAGTTIETSQDFFLEPTQVAMADYTTRCVNDYLDSDEVGGGYELTKVQFTDMVLDPRVDAFMVKTKERIEAEAQQTSDSRIAASKANEKVAAAKSKAEAALHEKTERAALADAKLDEVKKEAEGNVLLNKSISTGLTEYIKAHKWNGSHATTVLGSESKIEYQLTK